MLDRERCIQCARCTRFADEIAGDTLIDFVDRGDRTQVLNFAEQPFDSYFSGNTVQICPVGALTASQYRFRARPWDLSTVETSCTTCSMQCRGAVQSSSNRLVRLLGVDSEPVNHGWLCDKGRYGIEWIHADNRVREPHIRKDRELVQVSWPEALDVAVNHIEATKKSRRRGRDRGARRCARHERRRVRLGVAREGRDPHRQRRRAAGRRPAGRDDPRHAARRDRRLRPRQCDRAARGRRRAGAPRARAASAARGARAQGPADRLRAGRAQADRARTGRRARRFRASRSRNTCSGRSTTLAKAATVRSS